MAKRPRVSARWIYGIALFSVGLVAVFAANVRLLELQSRSRAEQPGSVLEFIGLIAVALVGLTIGGDSLRSARGRRNSWSQDGVVRALSVLGLLGFVAIAIFADDIRQVGPVAIGLLVISLGGAYIEFRGARQNQRMRKRRWHTRRAATR